MLLGGSAQSAAMGAMMAAKMGAPMPGLGIGLGPTAPAVPSCVLSDLACCTQQTAAEEEDEEGPEGKPEQRLLRLCVHHGKNMPKEPTFLEVAVDGGHAAQEMVVSPEAPASFFPTWDFFIEKEVSPMDPPSVEVKVMQAGLFPSMVGSTIINLEVTHTKRMEVKLKPPAGFGFCVPPERSVVVAWQLGPLGMTKKDLGRVADMGSQAMDRKVFHSTTQLKTLWLRSGVAGEVCAKISGEKLPSRDGMDSYPMTVMEADCRLPTRRSLAKENDKEDASVKRLGFRAETSTLHWELSESEAGLADYELRIELFARESMEPIGAWRERLNNLNDAVDERGMKLQFRALLQAGNRPTGEVEVLLDLHASDAPEHPDPSFRKGRHRIPIRKGRASAGSKGDMFYAHVGAIGITEGTPCLRVCSANGINISGHDFIPAPETLGKGHWFGGFALQTAPGSRDVTFELWNDPSLTKLLGKAVIFDAFVERVPCWRHIFGGSLMAQQEEEAEEMARGRRPRSTYQASLYIAFDRFSGDVPELSQMMSSSCHTVKACVRFYRGLYMNRYANQRVKVMIQVATCLGVGKEKSHNILEFPATVDSEGLACFQDAAGGGNKQPTFVEREVLTEIYGDVGLAYFYVVKEGFETAAPEVFGTIPLYKERNSAKVRWARATCDRSVMDVKEDWEDFAGFLLCQAVLETVDGIPAPPYEKEAAGSGWPACCAWQPDLVVKDSCQVVVEGDPTAETEEVLETSMETSQKAEDVPAAREMVPVYCHVDILAARSLQAADDDGLADPFFEVQVENCRIRSDSAQSEARRTLNPTFLQRVVLGPIELCANVEDTDGGRILAQDQKLSLPPIVVRVLDKDDRYFGKSTFAPMGQALIEDVKVLDGEKEVDLNHLNQHHKPVWYALDSDAKTNFQPRTIDTAWIRRPRLLVAAGYSLSAADGVGEVRPIVAEEVVRYDIMLDLLGIRNASGQGMEFAVTPFWSQPTRGSLPLRLQPDQNFRSNAPSLEEAETFSKKMQDLISFKVNDQDDANKEEVEKMDDDSDGDDSTITDDGTGAWHPLKVEHTEFQGWRISVPFSAPIIPYLQPSVQNRPGVSVPLARRKQLNASYTPFTLLPDLVFSLREGGFRGADTGSLCLSMPVTYEHLGEIHPDVMKKLHQNLRACDVLEDWVPEDASETDFMPVKKGDLVEVMKRDPSGWSFGTKLESVNYSRRAFLQPLPTNVLKQGWLPDWTLEHDPATWAEMCANEFEQLAENLKHLPRIPMQEETEQPPYDVYVDVFAESAGRLTWNDEFVVDKNLAAQHLFTIETDEEPILQYFNKADWMFDDPQCHQESFDWRVMPVLHCPDRSHQAPLGPAALWAGTGLKKDGVLAKKRTLDLQAHAKRMGYRLVSHQHAPEAVGNILRTPAYEQNLHTFVRQVGHRIRIKEDRDSKILARLRLSLPMHTNIRSDAEPVSFMDTQGARIAFSLEPTGMVKVTKDKRHLLSMPRTRALTVRKQANGGCALVLLPTIQVTLDAEEVARCLRKILAFFQPDTDVDEETPPSESFMANIAVIRFRKEGTVVWAAPEHITTWDTPGQLLFVVKLNASDALIPVRVPSFDLRFPQETAWYPCKTLSGGVELKKQLKAAINAAQVKAEPVPEGKSHNQKPERKEVEPDGYKDPISVAKYAFVCRMMKSRHTHMFDRARTQSWYRAQLADVFPEIAKLPLLRGSDDADEAFVKHFFLDRCMNIRRPLALDGVETCLLKGHVRAVESTSTVPAEATEQAVESVPMSRLWVAKLYVVNVYILTARGLAAQLRNPQIEVGIRGDEESFETKPATLVHEDSPSCDFYVRFSLDLQLPGKGELILRLRDEGMLGVSKIVGETFLDIEDRHIAYLNRVLRESSNQAWIQRNVSPETEIEVEWPEADPTGGWKDPVKAVVRQYSQRISKVVFQPTSKEAPQAFTPRLGPKGPSPIENWQLYDPEGMAKVAAIRGWLDLSSAKEPMPDVEFHVKKSAVHELRVKIASVENISIFKDTGERNDAFVKLELSMKSVGKAKSKISKMSSVHRWARKTASFCDLCIFHIQVPAQEVEMTVRLMDSDSLTGEEDIYAPKTLPLEPLVAALDEGSEVTSRKVATQVIFDSFPALHDVPTTGFWCCRRLVKAPRPATLHLELQILTASAAQQHEAKEGPYAEPKDRVNLASAMTRPAVFMQIFLGPKNVQKLKLSCCCAMCLLLSVIFLAIFYLLIQVFIVPFS